MPPHRRRLQVKQFFEMGLVNAIGGCCGSSFTHIKALADTAANFPPRKLHGVNQIMRISGLEPLNYVPDAERHRNTFMYIGERCNVAGSILYKRAIVDGDYDKAAAIAVKQARSDNIDCSKRCVVGSRFGYRACTHACESVEMARHVQLFASAVVPRSAVRAARHDGRKRDAEFAVSVLATGGPGGAPAGHQHGRRADRRRARDDQVCQPARQRPRGLARPLHDRLLQVPHRRGRPQVLPGARRPLCSRTF